jgi:exodeoxyribonuclease VII large subunit
MRDGLFKDARPWGSRPPSSPAAPSAASAPGAASPTPPPREPRFERRVWKVTEITRSLRTLIESRFASVWIEGEISNLKEAPSGHAYFTLKDADAQLRAVMYRRENERLRFQLQDGQAVVCRGRLTVYDKRGEYQLAVDEIEPRGSGALMLAFEQLRERLAAEGLFAAERKRALPLHPSTVGIVTSESGAAIHDLLQVMGRRDPTISVLLCPTRVQGEGAAQEIALAIQRLGRSSRVDVIIAGRGGGSLEDLWPFNEECVARAIVACPVPVVSAVGHETDFTIADFAADVRAPTPSAAAEIVVPAREELLARLRALTVRAARALQRRLSERRALLAGARQRLTDPRHMLGDRRRTLHDLVTRAHAAARSHDRRSRRRLRELSTELQRRHPARDVARRAEALHTLRVRSDSLVREALARHRLTFSRLVAKLDALSPLAILSRGYAILLRPDGRALRDAEEAHEGDRLRVRLHRGALAVRVEGTDSEPDEHGSG